MGNVLSVSVLVFQDDNILFINAGKEGNFIKFVLPGGRLEDGENIEDCAVRCVKEAAGTDIILDGKLSGVIARRQRAGGCIVTFVYLAEAAGQVNSHRALFLPYKEVESRRDISEFSKLIIRKLQLSSLSGMDRSKLKGVDGREYLMYF